MDFSRQIVVVTGAARGIGLVIAERALAAGARVVLSDRDAAVHAAIDLQRFPRAHTALADVASAASVAQLGAETIRVFGPPTIWVNNAGLARHRRLVDYTEAEIDLTLAVNLKGVIVGSQAALRAMAPQRCGHIINIISTAGLRGIPTETVYCAAKWGARGFTQGLREEAAPFNVRVTGVLPGGVKTPFWTDAVIDRPVPTQNFLTPEQVADAVMALVQMDENVVPQELVLRAMADRDFSS